MFQWDNLEIKEHMRYEYVYNYVEVENEVHFLFVCTAYDITTRTTLLTKIIFQICLMVTGVCATTYTHEYKE